MSYKQYTFFRSFYEAASELGDTERLRMYDAMNSFVFDGVEPDFSDSAILRMAWKLIVPNLEKSAHRSKTNSENAQKRTQKETEPPQQRTDGAEIANLLADMNIAVTDAETIANANDDFAKATDESRSQVASPSPSRIRSRNRNKDMDTDKEKEITREDAPSFPLLCLKALNDTLGTTYSCLPPGIGEYLISMNKHYSLDDVKSMIAFKQKEWTGTRFQKNLTPSTLFSQKHFESYVHQSRQTAHKKIGGERFAKYDN